MPPAARPAEIDYRKTAELKRQGLAVLFRDFKKYHLATGSDRARAFRMFKAEGGSAFSIMQRFLPCRTISAVSADPADLPGKAGANGRGEFHRPDTDEVRSFISGSRI